MDEDEDIWVKSNWTEEQLNRQSVECWIPQGQNHLHGIGEFLAKQDSTGKLAVELIAESQETVADKMQFRLYLAQALVDRIERHPDQSIARFRLS
jgi:hypothetical protein